MPTFTTHYDLNKPLVNNAPDADLWGGQLNTNFDTLDSTIFAISESVDSITGSIVSPGVVLAYAGSTAPTGYLLCFGQAVSRTTYATLFSVVSTVYGAGDGSTTFNLPDLRGRVAAGKDDMGGTAANRITSAGSGITGTTLGASGGTQTHTLVENELPPGLAVTGGVEAILYGQLASTSHLTTGGLAHQNTQPTMILNYIIKT